MDNLFYNEEVVEEQPLYSIHLDQLADREFEDFIRQIDYADQDSESMCVVNMHPGPRGLNLHLNQS